jgi:UDP-3-O-[3-hydroxymyristoyl] glucosamine N-acyltransferase
MHINEILKYSKRFEVQYRGGKDSFEIMGNLMSGKEALLTFCRDDNLDDIALASEKNNIAGLFIRKKYAHKIKTDATLIFTEKPYYDFHLFHQYLYENTDFFGVKKANKIAKSAKIHSSAIIEDFDIIIGENCKIGAGVVIHSGSSIGDNVTIGAGCVIGGESLHIAYDKGKRVFISHVGGVYIGNNSYLGSNNVIIRNVYKDPPTYIGENVAIANLAMIGHNARVEDGVQIISNVVLGGGCIIKKGARVSFGANVANYCVVGEKAFVSIGSVVTKDVPVGMKVSGNFAIEHSKRIQHVKEINRKYE